MPQENCSTMALDPDMCHVEAIAPLSTFLGAIMVVRRKMQSAGPDDEPVMRFLMLIVIVLQSIKGSSKGSP